MILRKPAGLVMTIGLALLVTGCNATREIAPGVTRTNDVSPPAAGEIRVSQPNPNPEKWIARVQTGARDGTVRTGYICKVLACPEPATVLFSQVINRAPRPDKAQLEKLAKETFPKLTQARNLELQVRSDNKAKIETLASSATKFGAYDGILNETKMTFGNKPRFMTIAMIMAGRMIITINAEAGDRVTARKAIDEFATSFTVTEGPPL